MSESLDRPIDVAELTAEEIQARVLHRDGLMLVIDKPAGLPVHRGPKGGANLEASFDGLRFGLPRPPVLAHRLDKDTSGCLVLGRHRKATASLGLLFKHGRISKTYWAVVEGGPADDEGTIEMPLAAGGRSRTPTDKRPLPTGRCWVAAAGWPGSQWNRSPAVPINCACIQLRPAGRSSAITSTATVPASASRGCICTPARLQFRFRGTKRRCAWSHRRLSICRSGFGCADGRGSEAESAHLVANSPRHHPRKRMIQYSRDASNRSIGPGVLGRPVKPGDDGLRSAARHRFRQS